MSRQKQAKWARLMSEKLELHLPKFIHPDLSLENQSRLIKIALHENYKREEVPFIQLHWGRVAVMDKQVWRKNLVKDDRLGCHALPDHWWVTVGENEDVIIDYRLQERLDMHHPTIPHGAFSKYDVFRHYRYISRGVIYMDLGLTVEKLFKKWGLN